MTIGSLSCDRSFFFSFIPHGNHHTIAKARWHERLFTTALGIGTGPRTPRIPWRRKPRLEKRGRWRRTSWSRRKPAATTTIRRRMIHTNTTMTSGRRRLPASIATSTATTTMSVYPCSKQRIISSRVPLCRQRKSVHLAGDARAAPSRACRCSSSVRLRHRKHPAHALPVSNPILLSWLMCHSRLRSHCVRITVLNCPSLHRYYSWYFDIKQKNQ